MPASTPWPPAAALHTPICDLLGCSYPVVLAGMGGVARSELVAAVGAAGGFGLLGMVREPVALIRAEVEAVRRAGDVPFGVNLIPAATPPGLLNDQVVACIELRVPVVCLFWDLQAGLVSRLHDAGILVVCQVGSIDDAIEAEQAGADVLIVQGVEAGGHVRGLIPLEQLLPDVAGATGLPLLAAGGIADGAGLSSAMSLGAQGAVIGTAFAASTESFAHDYHKQRLVAGRAHDTVLTDAFHINWPRRARVRVLANSVTSGTRGDPDGGQRTVIGEEEGRPIYLFSTDSPLRSMTGDYEAMALYAGRGVDRIDRLMPAGECLRLIVSQAAALMSSGAAPVQATPAPASAPCLLHELDPGQFGQLDRPSLLEQLGVLLEAERAGARVALRTAAQIAAGPRHGLVVDIQHDEARWCAVLSRAIRTLGGTPSRNTGAFYGKAMAIPDIDARMAFLNRGQQWVVRKLQELLPKIGDDALHADLQAMLEAHERNIARVDAAAKEPGRT